MRKLLTHFIIFFTYFTTICAQEATPFKSEKSFYIYGDATTIGNNILSKDVKLPFNEPLITNDDIEMVYVDVDQDITTFSSSSAQLKLPENQSNIVYAALYWTGTYSYIYGSKREQNGQLFFQGKRDRNRSVLSTVKLKLPHQNYQDIQGKVIFDGYKKAAFHLNAPYACYADVTKLLKNAMHLDGQITVANIHATQGFVAGGSSAGWMLYIVYEAPTTQPKFITTFNGFAHVGTDPVIINLKGFKVPEEGEFKTNLTLAALEGDSDITEDECFIANPKLKTATRLKTEFRVEKNFFNSTVNQNIKRIPDSKNTLGFDIATLTIENTNEVVLDNTTEEVELLFNTKEDRFYLFFTAFETEISKDFFDKIELNDQPNVVKLNSQNIENQIIEVKKAVITKEEEQEKTVALNSIKTNDSISFKTENNDVNQSEKEVNFKSKLITKGQSQQLQSGNVIISSSTYVEALKIKDKPLETQQFKLILEKNAAEIKGVKQGYYVITKFFSSPENAFKWQEHLKTKGYETKFLIDESKKLYYVYLLHTENFYDAYMQHKTLLEQSMFKDNWVFKVNMTDF